MVAFSNYLETGLLGVTLCHSVFTAPATIYIGLATSVTGDATSVTEVATGSYARQAALFDAPSSGACVNSADIVFPEATLDWGTLTNVLLFDASTSGNLLYYGPLSQSQAISSGMVFEIPDGSLIIGLD